MREKWVIYIWLLHKWEQNRVNIISEGIKNHVKNELKIWKHHDNKFYSIEYEEVLETKDFI